MLNDPVRLPTWGPPAESYTKTIRPAPTSKLPWNSSFNNKYLQEDPLDTSVDAEEFAGASTDEKLILVYRNLFVENEIRGKREFVDARPNLK